MCGSECDARAPSVASLVFREMAPPRRSQRSPVTPPRPKGVGAKGQKSARDKGLGLGRGDDGGRGGRGRSSGRGGKRGRAPESNAAEVTLRVDDGNATATVDANANAATTALDDEANIVQSEDEDERDVAHEERDAGDGNETPLAAVRAPNAQTGRFGPPIRAPPLLPEDIDRLSKVDRKRVLARWSGRLRGLKNRALELSRQFPTSNICFYFTKPFPVATRAGLWCVARPR